MTDKQRPDAAPGYVVKTVAELGWTEIPTKPGDYRRFQTRDPNLIMLFRPDEPLEVTFMRGSPF